VTFFYIIQKLGDDNFFSFQVGLNFFIQVCLFLRFKNVLKKISIFFYFFLYFKLIFLMFLYFFLILFLNILRLDLVKQLDPMRIY
jgi:hypothetical protein